MRISLLFLLAGIAFAQGRRGDDGADVWKALAERYDRDGDGRIAAAEYTRGEEKFARLDRDRDGALTAADFAGRRRGASRFAGLRAARAADADGDGVVTAAEWKAWLATLAPAGDGTIGADTLAAALRGGRRGRAGRGGGAERMATALDRDGDGAVGLADLALVFAELDRDGSGALEAGELGGRRGSSAPTPRAGDPAPDFELAYAKEPGKKVRLSSFAGKRPVALVFGSYT